MQLKEQVEKIRENLALLQALSERVSNRFPDGIISGHVSESSAMLMVNVGYSNVDRNNVLTLVGEVLGTADWTKKPDWQNTHLDWTKEIDGVKITISGAQDIPKYTEQPVHPTEFPLQLIQPEPEVEVML